MEEKVKNFLKRFHESPDIDEVFTSGCCFWFAEILFLRFLDSEAQIMYDSAANHFGTKVDGRVYDVTGDVTDDYKWENWNDFSDADQKRRISRDCIRF